jgi:DNA-binding GntR family transcriptional regulator
MAEPITRGRPQAAQPGQEPHGGTGNEDAQLRHVSTGPPQPSEDGRRVSSSGQIVREILRGLYQGRYVPGQKLTEADLTRRFGVGRGSVREALQRLAAEGVVTVSLHRGASIRALTRQEALDILEVIEALAALAARRAAERIDSPDHVKLLLDALTTLSDAVSTADSFELGRLRNGFYRQLAQLSGNRELLRLIPTVQVHLIRIQFRAAYGTDAEERGVTDYQRIVEAVLLKDGTKAERAMRQHVRRIARSIEALPDDNFGF